MDVFKFVLIGIAAAVLALSIKGNRPEIALMISIVAGILLLALSLNRIVDLIEFINKVSLEYNINFKYIAIALKIVGVACVCDIGVQICKDAGENSVAAKVELGGKLIVLLLSLPVITELLSLIGSVLAI